MAGHGDHHANEHAPDGLESNPEGGHDGGHEGGHGAHGHGKGHGKGGHDGGHGGGGHGGSWLVTYCDMITLLIAFFICILTFSSQENGKGGCRRMRDSVIYGPGGVGVAGTLAKAGEPDQVLWRNVLLSTDPRRQGSPLAPIHSDPSWDYTQPVLTMVDASSEANLGDRYALQVPTSMLFGEDATKEKLTPSGQQLLRFVANNLNSLPYDVCIEVKDAAALPRALVIAQCLIRQYHLDPARIGVGVATGNRRADIVRFVMLQRA
jgi:Membrane MotB of proton-channel complex MotA/MotB